MEIVLHCNLSLGNATSHNFVTQNNWKYERNPKKISWVKSYLKFFIVQTKKAAT